MKKGATSESVQKGLNCAHEGKFKSASVVVSCSKVPGTATGVITAHIPGVIHQSTRCLLCPAETPFLNRSIDKPAKAGTGGEEDLRDPRLGPSVLDTSCIAGLGSN